MSSEMHIQKLEDLLRTTCLVSVPKQTVERKILVRVQAFILRLSTLIIDQGHSCNPETAAHTELNWLKLMIKH
jgi:hypothetical protein